jgi:hypothetical protein
MSSHNDALAGARGIAIGVLVSLPLWLLIVGSVMLWYKCIG